jgi:hypothetical protein
VALLSLIGQLPMLQHRQQSTLTGQLPMVQHQQQAQVLTSILPALLLGLWRR